MYLSIVEPFIQQHVGPNYRIEKVIDGANNQCFKILSDTGNYFLKCFCEHTQNSHKKLVNEFQFTQLLHKQGIKDVATPIAYCEQNLVALYSLLPGQPIRRSSPTLVEDAFDFINRINTATYDLAIPKASDATEEVADFLKIVFNRLQRFSQIDTIEDVEVKTLLAQIEQRAKQISEQTLQWTLALECQHLSPSDFGFHNALIDADGKLAFFDFEYAGLDSYWKLVCDFFSQPKVPVDTNTFSSVSKLNVSPSFDNHKAEFLACFELTQLKWCLIMLNAFDPQIAQRRAFARHEYCFDSKSSNNQLSKTTMQLNKCKQYMQAIPEKLNVLDDILSAQHWKI
ncbi:aminoglycoside phosphotransferase family protein [Pseudoalteromonas byunsanensis]